MSVLLSTVFLLMSVSLLAGCSSSTTLIAIHTTTEPSRSIGVNFGHAYFGNSTNGEDQIVLLREPIDDAPEQKADQPLTRLTAPALTQVLVIQLHWRTAPAGNSDSPVANNAVLHWYVYGEPGDDGTGVVHYVGTGAVTFSPEGATTTVTIHNGELTLLDQHGPLRDPFGTFKIDGSLKATLQQSLMQQTMDDLHKAIEKATPTTEETQK